MFYVLGNVTFCGPTVSNNLEWFTRSNALDASKKHEYTLLFKARYFKIASLSANIHISVHLYYV